ncbi:Uncharacterized protein SCF082_LOCUS25699, partial [Durusdinium trenchii]
MRSATQTATDLVRLWSGYGDTLGDAQESTEQLSAVIEGLAVLVAGRATAAIASYAAAKGRSVVASIADAKAEATATAAIARRTEAELIAARTIQQRAIADAKATAGTNAHAFAMDNLTKATARASSAQAAHAAAANAAAAASSRASVAARAASGAMGLLGGPVGVVTTAVLALGYFATSADEASEKAVDLDSEIDKLAGSFERLSAAEAKRELRDMEKPFEDAQEKARGLFDTIQQYQMLLENNPEDKSAENWKNRLIDLQAELGKTQREALKYRETVLRLREIAEGGGSGAGDKPEDKPPGGGSNSGGSDAIQKRIDALSLEAETLGMTASEADLYRLKNEGATQSQLNAAQALYAQIDAHEALTEQQKLARQESDQLQASLGEVQERYATERTLLEEDLLARREIILESLEQKKIDEDEANQLMLASNQEYYDELQPLLAAAERAQAFLAEGVVAP